MSGTSGGVRIAVKFIAERSFDENTCFSIINFNNDGHGHASHFNFDQIIPIYYCFVGTTLIKFSLLSSSGGRVDGGSSSIVNLITSEPVRYSFSLSLPAPKWNLSCCSGFHLVSNEFMNCNKFENLSDRCIVCVRVTRVTLDSVGINQRSMAAENVDDNENRLFISQKVRNSSDKRKMLGICVVLKCLRIAEAFVVASIIDLISILSNRFRSIGTEKRQINLIDARPGINSP